MRFCRACPLLTTVALGCVATLSVFAQPAVESAAIVPSGGVDSRPNVVIIVADDLGWNDVGFHGSEIPTPNIDRLARSGAVLDRFYVQPTCSPTRASLLTGQSSVAMGIVAPLTKNQTEGIPLNLRLLPEYLKDANYQTFMSGKWHVGHHTKDQHPNARGFDHFYGFLRGGIGYWDHVHGGGLDWQRNGSTLREDGYSTHLLTQEAQEQIVNRDPERPFLLYLSYNAPHLPNEAPESTVGRFSTFDNPNRRIHAAMVAEMDAGIGEIIDTLRRHGLIRNTLIWFMSDNGGLNRSFVPDAVANGFERLQAWFSPPLPIQFLEFMRTNILDSAGDNSPLRRGKGSVYEGGVRVPAFVYWEGQIQAGEVANRLTVQDVLPTIAEAADLSLPDAAIDGVSQWPLLQGGKAKPPGDFMVQGADGVALLQHEWKVVMPSNGDAQLYNLEADPLEERDLSVTESRRLQSMVTALESFPRAASVSTPIWKFMLDPDFFGGEEDREPWSDQSN